MNNRRLPLIILAVVAFIVVLALSSSLFFTIQPRQKAVIFYPFGKGLDKDNVLSSGFHMKAPWNEVIVYDVAEVTTDETMDINDKNGLPIHVDVTIRYFPMHDKIGHIHEKYGPSYALITVIPEIRSMTRQVMAKYTAEEIYSTKRAEVETTIITETERVLTESFVNTTAVLIRSIKLPDQIRQAIESKLRQEQEFLAYQFRLQTEQKEAERKRIAAEGESRANNIINNSLSGNLLKMRGIEATLELAKSPNTKVIVVGAGDGGLPLILGNN